MVVVRYRRRERAPSLRREVVGLEALAALQRRLVQLVVPSEDERLLRDAVELTLGVVAVRQQPSHGPCRQELGQPVDLRPQPRRAQLDLLRGADLAPLGSTPMPPMGGLPVGAPVEPPTFGAQR